MLRINSISLFQFKNYANRSFSFPERITGICGRNGVGKTNLLDAIHYLCFTKSYFTRLDSASVRQGHSGFRLEAEVVCQGKTEKTVCILRETGKKEFSVDGLAYDRFSAHIGRYPCVIIAPDDMEIITGGSEERRRFLDALISQIDPDYLQHLIACNKILVQRNALLRRFAETGQKDLSLLDVIDGQLEAEATSLFEKRRDFLVSFLPAVKQVYQEISGQFEDISLVYDSELLTASLSELLKAGRNRDLASLRTGSGIHRDDLDFRFGEMPFRLIASQGQRKSLLFALKLAEWDVLLARKGFPPLLLLDDVFEKLDEDRIANLLERVCLQEEGQVFITDTNAERLATHLDQTGIPYQVLAI